MVALATLPAQRTAGLGATAASAGASVGGAPIFSLFREALPAARLMRFRGILNSTTNLNLTEMEQGHSFEAAVKKAQDRTQRRLRRHRRDRPEL